MSFAWGNVPASKPPLSSPKQGKPPLSAEEQAEGEESKRGGGGGGGGEGSEAELGKKAGNELYAAGKYAEAVER